MVPGMVSVTDYEICVYRWRKSNLALRIADQPAGQRVVSMLEKYRDPALLALFDDPVEAEIFFLLVEFIKETDKGRTPAIKQYEGVQE